MNFEDEISEESGEVFGATKHRNDGGKVDETNDESDYVGVILKDMPLHEGLNDYSINILKEVTYNNKAFQTSFRYVLDSISFTIGPYIFVKENLKNSENSEKARKFRKNLKKSEKIF